MSPGSLPILSPGNLATTIRRTPITTIAVPRMTKYLPIVPIPSGMVFSLQGLSDARADVGRALDHKNAGGFHCSHLLGGSSLPSGDDRACVTHSTTGRRCLACDEADHRLGHVLPHELRSLLLSRAADLADHHHSIRFGVLLKKPQRVEEVCADNRITAYSDRSRLAQPEIRELMNGFISQSPAARNDSHSHL